ncbi:MAG TPA: YoaK family protein [Variovorax sp.]
MLVPSRPELSATLQTALIVSFVGGFLDAYSYLGWNGVFAGAQSANILLAAIAAAQGSWVAAARHLPSVMAFCLGVAGAQSLRTRLTASWSVRVDLLALALEATLLLVVGLCSPVLSSSLATALMALAAGLQLGYFGHVQDWTYNSTMTTGNLRNLIEALTRLAINRDGAGKEQAIGLCKTIASFIVGGGIGGLATLHLEGRAICMVVPILFAGIYALLRTAHRPLAVRARA